ncbi:MAG TPA: D-alanyl-D-alanine carboxypeptidase family protein [Pseudogracilibacillus sp.]|nr:D-alanyl-D-alanine carboxypeptidase family protein [Pseudogracilibacillus sp.]
MNIFKSLIVFVLLTISFLTPTISYAETNNADLAKNTKAALLLERDTGTILYAKNEHEKLAPASLTKIMTLLLIMEAIEREELSVTDVVTVSERAASMGGSQVFLEAGEEMTVEDLIKAIAIASANDASVALAEEIAGTEEIFVQRMNEKVKELQLENTKFQNSSGLPAKDHYTTAYDMAIMSKELLKYEDIVNYTSIYEDYLRKGEENEFWLVNTNKLVRFHPNVDGLKTGYTSEAKYCLTASALKDDMRVVAVVMGAESSKERNATVSEMINYAFSNYETKKIYGKNETVATLRNIRTKEMTYDVQTNEQISLLYEKGKQEELDVKTEVVLHDHATLPIKRGDEVGVLYVKRNDEVMIEVPLTVAKTVDRATVFDHLKRNIKQMTKFANSSYSISKND